MIITAKELKRRARAILEGKYFIAVTMGSMLMLATFVMSFLLQYTGFGESEELLYQFFFWFLWAIMLILGALLEIGLIKFLYDTGRGESMPQPGVMFYAFQNQPDTFILTCGFRYLITFIWFVPAFMMFRQIPILTMELLDVLKSLLPVLGLALIAVIPAVIMVLPFCMTNYVLLDHPYAPAHEALLASWQLTKGQRGRILRIWISFLPICLAGIGSYGIGFLWIRPYYHTTMNQFYLELTGQTPVSQQPAEDPAPETPPVTE